MEMIIPSELFLTFFEGGGAHPPPQGFIAQQEIYLWGQNFRVIRFNYKAILPVADNLFRCYQGPRRIAL